MAFAFSGSPLPTYPSDYLAVLLPSWEIYGLTVFYTSTGNGLGLASSPMALLFTCPQNSQGQPAILPFGSSLIALVGLFDLTTFISNSLRWPYLPSQAPRPHNAWTSLTVRSYPFGRATLSEQLDTLVQAHLLVGYYWWNNRSVLSRNDWQTATGVTFHVTQT